MRPRQARSQVSSSIADALSIRQKRTREWAEGLLPGTHRVVWFVDIYSWGEGRDVPRKADEGLVEAYTTPWKLSQGQKENAEPLPQELMDSKGERQGAQ